MVEVLRWVSIVMLWIALAANLIAASMNISSRRKYLAAEKKVWDMLRDLGERPRITFCRNCEYRKKATVNDKGFLICPASGMEITDQDYCSYGEPVIKD